MRWRLSRAAAVLIALSVLAGCGGSPAPASSTPPASSDASGSSAGAGFVYRRGRTLMLGGAPYRFVGFNAFGMAGCATGTPWTRDELDAYFATLPANAMTRTWAFQPWGTDALDAIVASARRHDQRLILSLTDSTGECRTTVKDAGWYGSGYRDNYLPWVRTVVGRYAESSAVAMWEIINEPGHTSTVDETTLKAFLDTVAATIKGIDPHHLVESGAMGEYAPGNGNFALLHSGPDIDVGSLHEYDYTAGDRLVVSHHLASTLPALSTLDKPLIVGEVGINSGPDCPISLAARRDAMRAKFDAYLRAGAVGVLVWNYTPNPGTECGYAVRATPDDPLVEMVASYRLPTG